MKTYKTLSMTEQIALQEENEILKTEKNNLIARIADLTLEKADMGAKLQGIEEYCEQEKTKVQHMIDCLETGDDFCAVDKGRVEAYTDILSRLKDNRLFDEVVDKDSECDQADGKRKQIGGNHYAKHTIQPCSANPTSHNNGGSTDYYKLPVGATELQDIIEHKNMHWNVANMFKALYRMGQQDHSSIERDLNKIEYFLNRHRELLKKNR